MIGLGFLQEASGKAMYEAVRKYKLQWRYQDVEVTRYVEGFREKVSSAINDKAPGVELPQAFWTSHLNTLWRPDMFLSQLLP